MADKDITIGIKTTGADAAAREIVKLDKATEGLSQTAGKDAARAMENMSDKARVSEFAHYDLDAAVRETSNSMGTFTAGQTRVQASSRNSAQALLLFSQGFEDAQYGIRGVLNNIPGLIFAMGGTAGLAGAISIAAVGLSQIIPLFQKSKEESNLLKEALDSVKDSAGELEEQRFQEAADSIDNLRERSEALEQSWDDTRAAETAFSTAALDNATNLAEAQRTISDALGEQVDQYRALQAIAEEEAAKRELAAQQAIAAEEAKLSAQALAVTKAADELQAQKQRSDIEQANLAQARARLELLREERDELERIQNRKIDPGGIVQNLIRGAPAQAADVSRQRDQRNQAREQLADPVFQGTLKDAEGRLEKLENLVENLTKDGGIVTRAENAFLAAQTQLTDLSGAVGENISRIEQTLAADNLVARSQNVAATREQEIKDLSAAVSQIESSSQAGLAAKETIAAAAADGRITAAESQQLAQASVQLIGQIQAGLATAGTNTTETLALLRSIALREQKTRRELAELRRLITELQ
jgi:hypothetical protein